MMIMCYSGMDAVLTKHAQLNKAERTGSAADWAALAGTSAAGGPGAMTMREGAPAVAVSATPPAVPVAGTATAVRAADAGDVSALPTVKKSLLGT
jgi:hypothetical protein